MLGKASEIKVEELQANHVNGWLASNPNAQIIDIKYGLIQSTEHVIGGSYALIIYKEAGQ